MLTILAENQSKEDELMKKYVFFFCYSPAVITGLKKVTKICFKLAFIHVKQSNLPNSARNRFAT